MVGIDQTDPTKVLLKRNGRYLRTSKTVWNAAQALLENRDPATLNFHPGILAAARKLVAPEDGRPRTAIMPRTRVEIAPEALIKAASRLIPGTMPASLILLAAAAINAMFVARAAGAPHIPVTANIALAVAGAMFVIIAIHEVAHAAVATRFGCQAHRIGIGLFVVLPVFYADVSEIWRLTRARRIAVNSAGIAAQLAIGALLIAADALAGPNPVLQAVILTNLASIALNLIPFAKLDGYWILSDWIGITDLQDQAATTISNRFKRGEADTARSRFIAAYALASLCFFAAIALLTVRALADVARIIVEAPSWQAILIQSEARPLTWLFAFYTLVWLGRQTFRKLGRSK
ncbi:MAG: M50 family metallopeptidase [Betaproteobacteria bacterium]|nr:M50 family metallopeptidase [Betaproteobacteria bacterium]